MILWSKWTEGVCFHDGCGNLEESLFLSDYNADTSKILFVSVKIRAAVKAGRPSAWSAVFITAFLGISSF